MAFFEPLVLHEESFGNYDVYFRMRHSMRQLFIRIIRARYSSEHPKWENRKHLLGYIACLYASKGKGLNYG
jgi:hypothetical protein